MKPILSLFLLDTIYPKWFFASNSFFSVMEIENIEQNVTVYKITSIFSNILRKAYIYNNKFFVKIENIDMCTNI